MGRTRREALKEETRIRQHTRTHRYICGNVNIGVIFTVWFLRQLLLFPCHVYIHMGCSCLCVHLTIIDATRRRSLAPPAPSRPCSNATATHTQSHCVGDRQRLGIEWHEAARDS